MASVPAWWGDVEHGLALVVLPSEHDIARRGGWFSVVVPLSAGGTLSWLECSPSILLQCGQTSPSCCAIWGKGGRSFLPRLTP
jgi:hypothetical protein